MHVVIGGFGRVGRRLAQMLLAEGHSVAVIDNDVLSFEDVDEGVAADKIVGAVFDRGSLEAAGIERADVFAAVTSGDNSNIVSARIALEDYHVPRVVARIYDPRRAEIYRNLGIPTIASVTWTTQRLFSLTPRPDTRVLHAFGNGEFELLALAAGPNLQGRRLAETEAAGAFRVAAIVQGGAAIMPADDIVVEAGDTLYVSAMRAAQEGSS